MMPERVKKKEERKKLMQKQKLLNIPKKRHGLSELDRAIFHSGSVRKRERVKIRKREKAKTHGNSRRRTFFRGLEEKDSNLNGALKSFPFLILHSSICGLRFEASVNIQMHTRNLFLGFLVKRASEPRSFEVFFSVRTIKWLGIESTLNLSHDCPKDPVPIPISSDRR